MVCNVGCSLLFTIYLFVSHSKRACATDCSFDLTPGTADSDEDAAANVAAGNVAIMSREDDAVGAALFFMEEAGSWGPGKAGIVQARVLLPSGPSAITTTSRADFINLADRRLGID